MSISHLDPQPVFSFFEAICAIPHPSGHEQALAEYIVERAREKGLDVDRDEAWNVVVRVPATVGHENAPVVILQGHIDMVGEANAETNHDFLEDPIQPYAEGDLVKARGTTLGADNGLGVAAGLAIAEDKTLVHGPLEILCTVDEEVGLTGASKLRDDFIKGRIMLNLDGEESNAAYIGCAGGGDTRIRLPIRVKPRKATAKGLFIKVAGLKGGHSGCDIHEQRGNALRVMGRCLGEARRKLFFVIADIQGGNKRNALARECHATVALAGSNMGRFKKAVAREAAVIREELAGIDPGLEVTVEAVDLPDAVCDTASSEKIVKLLLALPHGVERMSDEIEGLVETSTNLASVILDGSSVRFEMSTRSSLKGSLEALRKRIAATATLAGAEVEEGEPYPGWKPNLKSKLAKIFAQVHEEALGVEPELQAIHAGLETGVIGEKFPGMDMISFGPDIRNPHSPDEELGISSVQRFWKLLRALLERLA